MVSPSNTNAIWENPAGLIYTEDFKAMVGMSVLNQNFNAFGASGAFYLGNGLVGGGIGLHSFSNLSNNSNAVLLTNFGIAADIRPLYFALGVSGSYLINSWNYGVGSTGSLAYGLNIGIIANPQGDLRWGFNVFDILGGPDALGSGVVWDPTSFASLGLDVTTNLNFQGFTFKPGMAIHIQEVQLTGSYGFQTDVLAGPYMRTGLTAGIGFRIPPWFHIQIYYNELAFLYGALQFQI